MNPLVLNDVVLLDALLYELEIDLTTQTATLTIEVDPKFHSGIGKLVELASDRESLIELAFSGVEKARINGMPKRRAEWASDEKPHDYEITRWKVRRASFRTGYEVEIHCALGQAVRVSFGDVTVRESPRPVGIVHDYGAAQTSS